MTNQMQLLVLGLLALAPACKRVEGAQAPSRGQAQPQRPPAPVSVATAVERDVPVYLDQIGKNAAPEVVTIQPQVSGRITRIHVKDGATVKRGDPLFTIDPRPYQAQLDSAEASLARNLAELELARLEFARVQRLLETDAISQQDHDSRRSAVAVSEAQVRTSASRRTISPPCSAPSRPQRPGSRCGFPTSPISRAVGRSPSSTTPCRTAPAP